MKTITPTTDNTRDFQQQVLTELRELKQEVEQFNQELGQFNPKFDHYQKATQWVVRLAFSLIAAATVTVIISTVLGKSSPNRLHLLIDSTSIA